MGAGAAFVVGAAAGAAAVTAVKVSKSLKENEKDSAPEAEKES